MTTRHEVCPAADLPPGERRIVTVEGLSIGVFNVGGEFHALANVCPHQLAELCRGQIGAEVTSSGVGEYERRRDGEIVRCPRHKWAFDITTGESVFNPHLRTRSFEVAVEPTEESAEGKAEDDAGAQRDVAGQAGVDRQEGDDGQEGDDDSQERAVEGDDGACYGVQLAGDEPPVDTYPVEVEDEYVVVYV